jgi:hypothetical protein
MHKPVATSEPRIVRLLLVVAALVGAGAALTHSAACSTESGTTPSCTQDETDDAGHLNIDGGCNPHALCLDGDGGLLPVLQCCTGETQLTLASCLEGYDAKCTDNNGKEIDALTAKNCCAPFAADAGSTDVDFCMHGFHAKCFDGTGAIVPAAQCCQGKKDSALQFCLYAYGGDLPGTSTSSSSSGGAGGSTASSSSSSSTSSSSSSSGAGGGP